MDALRTNTEELMLELVEKYSHFHYPPRVQTNKTNGGASGKVVVLTGATGSFGSYILDEFLADPDVETIYCLCRAEDDAGASARITASMKTRRLLTRFSDAQVKADERVVALAADLPADRLGLDEDRHREIANRATTIIHVCALSSLLLVLPYLDRLERLAGQFQPEHLQVRICTHDRPVWVLTVGRSFETHIRGAVKLMHLALSSPHPERVKFFFASSISAVLNWPGPGSVPEAVIDDPAVAQGMG